jgi:EAL domain-containing protein (putative c-di-GMP-specific phosphodiesterase class I)
MIQMAADLGMELIAEGVETKAQAEFLHSKGCDDMQGFYFYKPIPVKEVEELDEWS